MAYGILKMFKLLKQISVLYQLYLADFSFFFFNLETVKLIQSANSCLDTCRL